MMADIEDKKDKPEQAKPDEGTGEHLDTASRSLSEALRVSFMILKVIMVILVVAFLASGFKTINSDEEGLLLRFGKFKPVGEERVLKPGPHWVLPYPIDEVVRIPVEKKVNLAIRSFWYYQTESELLGETTKPKRVPEKLDPVQDGYCLTRSEPLDQPTGQASSNDYNIVHSKWQLTYQIYDAERFFRNVYVRDVKPGEVHFDVVTESVKPLLQSVLEDAVVTALVNYTIDEAIKSKERIPRHVQQLVQEKLDAIGSGIKVVSVYLTEIRWPRQVDEAFEAFITASQESQRMISEARTEAENILNEAAGPVARQLYQALQDPNSSEQDRELLWAQLAGKAQEILYQAQAYRTQVVKNAKASADYLRTLLPEYRKRPQLVIQRLYLDALESILNNDEIEKMFIQPTEGAAGKELRIMINRDPKLKRNPAKAQSSQQQNK